MVSLYRKAAILLGPSALLLLTGHSAPGAVTFEKDVRPLLAKYCFQCHGEDRSKADVNLEQFTDFESVVRSSKLFDDVLEQIRAEEMPPVGEDQFSEAEKQKVIAWLESMSKQVQSGDLVKDPGRVTVRRLNRDEYNHTVRDLLGVRFRPGDDFPADGAGGEGFNNNGDTLFLPPLLMEKYFHAATRIADAVFADEELKKRFLVSVPGPKSPPEAAARKVIRYYLPLAYRRHVEPEEIETYVKLFNEGIKRQHGFDGAMKLALKGILVSPKFLFRIEEDQEVEGAYRVSDFELASRLSYFLWSSMPDRELLRLASTGSLRDPEVYRRQVVRMIASPKAKALAWQFASQWLGFDKIREKANPDQRRFPLFTPSLRASMYRESVETFHYIVRENRPVTDLLHADYSFLNEELAKLYGIRGVIGSRHRKVALDNPNRGGVLGMASILTASSLPLRTSPVKRGTWVLETLLGTPPPPPPQDAGELPADDAQPDGLTARQRLERHRMRAECAGCHNRIDPIGFGLENFDPIGRWRTKSLGRPIDSKGRLPDGRAFDSPAELKKLLLLEREKFAGQIAEKMVAYALGRGLEFYDRPVIRKVKERLIASEYRIQPMILEIATSFPFLHRRNDPLPIKE